MISLTIALLAGDNRPLHDLLTKAMNCLDEQPERRFGKNEHGFVCAIFSALSPLWNMRIGEVMLYLSGITEELPPNVSGSTDADICETLITIACEINGQPASREALFELINSWGELEKIANRIYAGGYGLDCLVNYPG